MTLKGLPWVVFTLEKENYAVNSQHVMAICNSLPVTKIPNSYKHVKGMVRYRDEIFKLYDMRQIIDFKSLEEEINEFQEMMDMREADHRKWLAELESAAVDNREFKLATDPHKCAFGKWYDSFKSEDLLLNRLLSQFEKPHEIIHSIAKTVEEYKLKGHVKLAKELIEETRNNELSVMIKLFTDIKTAYKHNLSEKVIILKREGERCALAVDKVLSVESIEHVENKEDHKDLLRGKSLRFDYNIGRLNSGEFIMLLSESDFFSGTL